MARPSFTPYIVVLCLMGLTALALTFGVDVNLTNQAGVRLEIPDQVELWSGVEILYCQNPDCKASREIRDGAVPAVCPTCSTGVLDPMSILEKELLPIDTGMVRKRFTGPSGAEIHASIVLSGKERGSIHRPELCLTGQGRKITGQSILNVPMQGRSPLQVQVLDMEVSTQGPGGPPVVTGAYYAYWFVGNGRETPHHLMRMFWMAADRVLFNIAHRWAYVSVSGSRDLDSDAHLEEITSFAQAFYPAIVAPE